MFRRHGLGNFRDLLVNLARDPGMIFWLDNQDNHKRAPNENWGRELLELFSLGVGYYTEKDVYECARAFTGWTFTGKSRGLAYPPESWRSTTGRRTMTRTKRRSWGSPATSTARRLLTSSSASRPAPGSSCATCTASSWRMSRRCPSGRTSGPRTPRPSTCSARSSSSRTWI